MNFNPHARISIVAYKPKPGKESELIALAHEHIPFLRREGLVSDRPHVIATAGDGTVVEVFEWAEGGLEKAHGHPGVAELWARYSVACDYVPMNTLDECNGVFANFVPIN